MKRFLLLALCLLAVSSPAAAIEREFTGAALDKPQITTISPTGSWDSGKTAWIERNNKRITVTLDSTASRKAVVVLLQQAIEATGPGSDTDPNDADGVTGSWDQGGLDFGEFGEVDATADYTDPNAPVLTLTSAELTVDNKTTTGIPFTVTTGDDDPNAAIGTPTNTQEASGRHHFDDGDNWKDPNGRVGVPDPNDTLVFAAGSGSIYFGLNNSNKNQRLDMRDDWQGSIGLKSRNAWQSSRTFAEDREQFILIEPTTGANITHNIGGRGVQSPKGHRKIDFGTADPTLIVCHIHNSASSSSDGQAIQIVGGLDVELNVYKGSVSVGASPQENPTRLIRLQTFHVSNAATDVDMIAAAKTTFVNNTGNVNIRGGKVRLDANCNGSANEASVHDGVLTVMPTVEINDLFVYGGKVDYRGINVVDIEVHQDGKFDASKCEESGQGIVSLFPGFEFIDPKAIFIDDLKFPGGRPGDGKWEVRRDIQIDITPL